MIEIIIKISERPNNGGVQVEMKSPPQASVNKNEGQVALTIMQVVKRTVTGGMAGKEIGGKKFN